MEKNIAIGTTVGGSWYIVNWPENQAVPTAQYRLIQPGANEKGIIAGARVDVEKHTPPGGGREKRKVVVDRWDTLKDAKPKGEWSDGVNEGKLDFQSVTTAFPG